VSQCSRLNLPAGTIIYYSYPSPAALASGVSKLLSDNHFRKSRECTTGNDFTDFLVECQTDFHNQTPFMTGSIAEYSSTSNAPIIVTSDNQQNVMAVLVGDQPRRAAVVLEEADLDQGLAGRLAAPSRSR